MLGAPEPVLTPLPLQDDCNQNGIPDWCDVEDMDCNNNGVPDDCDVDPADPDGNGLVSADCNANGIPDECELADNDCNANTIPDDCELDTDADGLIDDCDVCPTIANGRKIFHFDTLDYGMANDTCANNPLPPLFNRPGYAAETAPYIMGPAGCGEGDVSNGNDSFLTNAFSSSAPNSNEVRFSWQDPANDDSWLRLITLPAPCAAPRFRSPAVYIGPGGRVSMDITIWGLNALGFESTSGQLEFALIIRETDRKLAGRLSLTFYPLWLI